MLLPPALGFSPHPPVSVYGTGILKTIAAFLDSWLTHFPTLVRSASRLWIATRFFLCHPPVSVYGTGILKTIAAFPFHTPLLSTNHAFGLPTCDSVLQIPRACAGISTCCPSDTHFCLSLGPDLPRADQLYPGNLGYSAERIPTSLSLLIPAFSLPGTPQLLPVLLHRASNAPLPYHTVSCASVSCFSPGHFRRRTSRLVSYYALFECVAASEPTS